MSTKPELLDACRALLVYREEIEASAKFLDCEQDAAICQAFGEIERALEPETDCILRSKAVAVFNTGERPMLDLALPALKRSAAECFDQVAGALAEGATHLPEEVGICVSLSFSQDPRTL